MTLASRSDTAVRLAACLQAGGYPGARVVWADGMRDLVGRQHWRAPGYYWAAAPSSDGAPLLWEYLGSGAVPARRTVREHTGEAAADRSIGRAIGQRLAEAGIAGLEMLARVIGGAA